MRMGNFIYKNLIKPFFFLMEPETAHNRAISLLKAYCKLPFHKEILKLISGEYREEIELMGLKFKNPIGLAAGFDKNGEVYDILSEFGFGFIEIGTITLSPQKGNPKPRLFRYPKELAIVNRMGFNNIGAEATAKNLMKKRKIKIPLGINIGKNTDCPIEKAYENYATAYKILNSYGDFFVINISCPNIKDLCKLHNPLHLREIIEAILKINSKKPLFLKIMPNINALELKNCIDICLEYKIGIIAANTLPSEILSYAEIGGISGRPLKNYSENILKSIREISKKIPVISSGGIFSVSEAKERMSLGANLTEIYTSIIYNGPFVE